MSDQGQPTAGFPVGNKIIARLAPQDRQLLARRLRPVSFGPRETIFPAGGIRDCLFIERGAASLMYGPDETSPVEVGLVGVEGMLGVAVALGARSSLYAAVTVTAGEALAVSAGDLREACQESPQLQDALLRYASTRMAEAMRRAACAVQHRLEQRLADWILATTARLDASEISVTHQRLSELLGATRPGVTLAIQQLEGRLAVRATRNLVSVRSRAALGAIACGCCGARAEQRRPPVGLRATTDAAQLP